MRNWIQASNLQTTTRNYISCNMTSHKRHVNIEYEKKNCIITTREVQTENKHAFIFSTSWEAAACSNTDETIGKSTYKIKKVRKAPSITFYGVQKKNYYKQKESMYTTSTH